jgi:alkanesulfonate monooxygenase
MESSRFHWTLPTLREAPELDDHVALCREAERNGIDSVLVRFDLAGPDPFAWSAALGRRTESIRFLLACRPGVSSPTYWTQQINTLAAVLGGRVGVLVVTEWEPAQQLGYGDAISRDDWYARTDEFWQVCHGLWGGSEPVRLAGRHYQIDGATINAHFVSDDSRNRPEIYVGGPFRQSLAFGRRHADCVLVRDDGRDGGRDGGRDDGPDELAGTVRSVLDAGVRAGLVATVSGAADDVVATINRCRAAGVTQFLLSGGTGPSAIDRLRSFGEEVLPRIREQERSTVPNGAGRVPEGEIG